MFLGSDTSEVKPRPMTENELCSMSFHPGLRVSPSRGQREGKNERSGGENKVGIEKGNRDQEKGTMDWGVCVKY
jgi:hypothetical protein